MGKFILKDKIGNLMWLSSSGGKIGHDPRTQHDTIRHEINKL